VLSVLTVVTDPGEAAWVEQFHAMRAAPRTYYSVVIVDKASDQIVGVGTVFIERKFLRGLGSVGHIEDIAVDKKQQGKKLGLRIIQALTYISENSGCYKTILNCSDDNVRECPMILYPMFPDTDYRNSSAFYKKCGFEKKENEMVGRLVKFRLSRRLIFFVIGKIRSGAHSLHKIVNYSRFTFTIEN
jgi:glucosamine-phosphate N-acetyltransferase